MTGRRPSDIWVHYIKIKEVGKPLRAKCKYCCKEMCALVSRMKKHIHMCNRKCDKKVQIMSESTGSEEDESEEIDNKMHSTPSSSSTSIADLPLSTASQLSSLSSSLSSFVVKTSKTDCKLLDLQVAKFIYSTNSSFRLVEHPEFKKMINVLRPGYKPPNRRQIANELLDEVHCLVRKATENHLKGKMICMAMDGWSNIHVKPIVCISVTDFTESDGNIHLIDTIDTADNRHTAEYLYNLAVNAIKTCQKFGCIVKSFVTDNASNMVKMRSQLAECDDIGMPDIITYGCSAHILNLLAKDIDVPGLKDEVKKIVKYFRNTHFPASKYKQASGTSLILPIDVRWNSLADCFESYLKNWHILAKVCTENRVAIDVYICSLIQDLDFKTKVQNFLFKLKKISTALDKIQNETCSIAEAAEIWLNLIYNIDLDETFSELEISCFKKRFHMAMTPTHYLANLLDHRFRGQKLKQEHLEEALDFVGVYHPEAMPFIIKYQAQTSPFKEYLFSQQNIEIVPPVSWWRALNNQNTINSSIFELSMQLHTAVASSAGIERLFSSFGLVHSKLRNRLGTQKAAKLVGIIRAYNSNKMINDNEL